MRHAQRCIALTGALLLCACARRAPVLLPPGEQLEVVFTQDSPLASNAEIARRTLTPLTWRHGQRMLDATGRTLRTSPLDLAQEKFSLYLPAGGPPPAGYGVLVFVPPWPEATRPHFWRETLDQHRLIFVAAENSGNEAKILDRRLPLAVLALENVRARYPIDPRRVYVGGLSGGSRAAEITALAYPDLFRGALLNAGSDPVDGSAGIYLPPDGLFRAFQETRLVYVTGEHDELNLHDDDASRASMRERCVLNLATLVARRLGHEPLDPVALARALDALDQPSRVDRGELARCNGQLAQELAGKLADAEAALARGDRDGARARLKDIDARYGGLAAPAIFALDDKLRALDLAARPPP